MQNWEKKKLGIHAVSEGYNATVIDPHFVCHWISFPHKQDFWNPLPGFLKQLSMGSHIKFDSFPTTLP